MYIKKDPTTIDKAPLSLPFGFWRDLYHFQKDFFITISFWKWYKFLQNPTVRLKGALDNVVGSSLMSA